MGTRGTRIGAKAGAAGVALVAVGLIGAADAPTGGDPHVRAFVLSNVYLENAHEPGVCKPFADGGLEAFYKMLPPEEQAKYATPDKRPALEQAMNRYFGFRISRLNGRAPEVPAPVQQPSTAQPFVIPSGGVMLASAPQAAQAQRAPAGGGAGGAGGVLKYPADFKPGDVVTQDMALKIAELNGYPKGKGKVAFAGQQLVYTACSYPYDFQVLAKSYTTYNGKMAAGINLDGKVGKSDFVGPNGEKGVDNQLWRAVGCSQSFQENGDPKIANDKFSGAVAPAMIEITGIDDARNDPDVVVHVYSAVDAVPKDARGGALSRASYKLNADPALRSSVHGRIVNGVLTTDPFEFQLRYKEQIMDVRRQFRAARIRAELKPDGGVEGNIYGYYDIDSFYLQIEHMTQNGANLTGVNCPGIRAAIDKLADAYPDPKTGRNTAISAAYRFVGVRAFIVEPKGRQVASAN